MAKVDKRKYYWKMFDIILSLYINIKSKIVTSEGSSAFFDCNIGVRQVKTYPR